ncbi:Uncharacterised protein [Klebsiella variicola]|uniref:Uncharacterized protein n=1 Tax=Klebsiella variicola TaxID=244366 RepID=A0A7H4MIM5_KLEVA|nr:Uncharacterised protein [Klebsiella variicola]
MLKWYWHLMPAIWHTRHSAICLFRLSWLLSVTLFFATGARAHRMNRALACFT